MTKEPTWIEKLDLLAIHEKLIYEFGGLAGIRDERLLESALGSPKSHFAYGEKDLFRLAAAYAYALTRNHPFVDGNKRAAFMATYVFLETNGYRFNAKEEEIVWAMISLSEKTMTEREFTEWLRESCARRKKK